MSLSSTKAGYYPECAGNEGQESRMKRRIAAAFLSIFLTQILLGMGGKVEAQGLWNGPDILSNRESRVEGLAEIVADSYGFVHVFWVEKSLRDDFITINYARFDGETWSAPVDLVARRGLGVEVALGNAVVDRNGNLYLTWMDGIRGPAFLTSAPVYDALSAQKWQPSIPLEISAYESKLQVDSKGVLHVLFNDFYGSDPGIYYLRSEDGGVLWSAPFRVDPDRPANYLPLNLKFLVDESDNLHASWEYSDLNTSGFITKVVRYARSSDGGGNWSTSIIDEADESSDEVRVAGAVMAVQGQNIHVIWAGDQQIRREYRFSMDAGVTWSSTSRVFGDLQGAAGDGISVDGAGRIHYVAQIRYPQGLYHAYLEQGQWSTPALFYLISLSPSDPIGDRIHAHRVRLAVRAGNQLVVVFRDPPGDPQQRLFSMYLTLNDIQPSSLLPIPTPDLTVTSSNPTPVVEITSPTATPTSQPLMVNVNASPQADLSTPADTLLWAIIPALILIGGVITLQLRRNH